MTKRLSLLLTTFILPVLFLLILVSVHQIRAGGPYDICALGCTYSTIQTAVDADATVGQTLTIAPETFSETVQITRSITLVGAGSNATIIDGQNSDTVILINNGATVSLSGVTIQNGETTAVDGGGLLNEDGHVTLSQTVVQNNQAPNGAGITNNGTMILDQVTVRNNVADEFVGNDSICEDCAGGGIYNLSVMTITNSLVAGNTAQFGGGIDNAFMGTLAATNVEVTGNAAEDNPGDPSAGGGIENLGVMTLSDSAIHNNSAPIGAGVANGGTLTVSSSDLYANVAATRGGGLHNSFELTVETSNIYGNQAGSGGGGGLSSESGGVLVRQTAVYNNSATGSGGGIVHNVPLGSNSFVIRNSTISGNSTSGTGGGLRNAGVASTTLENVTLRNNQAVVVNGQSISVFSGTLTAKNSLIATNQSGNNCAGTIGSQGYNIANDNSCSLNATADLPNTTPLLGPLQNNGGNTLTHALLVGSPAIDSGNNCPAEDQRGVSRPFGAACDRGAYEFDGTTQSVYLPFVVR